MTIARRDVLIGAALGVGVLSSRQSLAAEAYCATGKLAVLKLSSQEGPMPGKDLKEKLDNMEKWGFSGLEVGGRGLAGRVTELKEALKGRPIKMSAICAGFEGWIMAEDKAVRDKCMASMKAILTAAGELGSTGLIIVPAFNGNEPSVPHKQARELLTGFARWDDKDRKRQGTLLGELAEHAAKCGTRILLEPLNRQECYFMRTLADAASMCRDIESPGLAMMGDFWHMTWEETSDQGAFLTAGPHLHHVHIASRRSRAMPGQDGEADNYVDGFKGLKAIGYQDYVSLECGCKKGQDPMVAVPAAAELIRKQWEQA